MCVDEVVRAFGCVKSRRFFFFFVLSFIFNFQCLFSESLRSYIVVDFNAGEVLYSSNADKTTQPASLAKVMSFYVAFKALKQGRIKQETPLAVSKYAASQPPCKLGLPAGSAIAVRDAILGMMTKSANDASVVLAEGIAGSEENFAKMMNKEAKRLRMNSTVFYNASGYKNIKQLTSARDMAKLAVGIMKDFPQYYPLFSTKQFHYKGKRYANHNKILGERGGITVDGLKTGFVCASGYNIIVSAKKGTDRLVVVVCGGATSQKRNQQVEYLLSQGFNKLAKKRHMRCGRDKEKGRISRLSSLCVPQNVSTKKDKALPNNLLITQQPAVLSDTAESEITEKEAQSVNIEKFEKISEKSKKGVSIVNVPVLEQ